MFITQGIDFVSAFASFPIIFWNSFISTLYQDGIIKI